MLISSHSVHVQPHVCRVSVSGMNALYKDPSQGTLHGTSQLCIDCWHQSQHKRGTLKYCLMLMAACYGPRFSCCGPF